MKFTFIFTLLLVPIIAARSAANKREREVLTRTLEGGRETMQERVHGKIPPAHPKSRETYLNPIIIASSAFLVIIAGILLSDIILSTTTTTITIEHNQDILGSVEAQNSPKASLTIREIMIATLSFGVGMMADRASFFISKVLGDEPWKYGRIVGTEFKLLPIVYAVSALLYAMCMNLNYVYLILSPEVCFFGLFFVFLFFASLLSGMMIKRKDLPRHYGQLLNAMLAVCLPIVCGFFGLYWTLYTAILGPMLIILTITLQYFSK